MAYGFDNLSRLVDQASPEKSVRTIIGPGIAATLALLAVLVSRLALQHGRLRQRKIILPSPRETLLPRLSAAEKLALPYPPDILPGGRDVDSPYGTVRVYEWGPEEGRKVLLVHGITTPCISLGGIAHGLAERGCRVMLLDLWGRGYSDSCSDLPHDDRLYATEILVALTSSSLSWTGGTDGGFCLIGYSLGGGISAAFTSYFPNLVKSLVLLAPTGILRPEHTSERSRLLYSAGLVPEHLFYWLIKKRLKAGPMKRPVNRATPTDMVGAEVEGNAAVMKRRPLSTVRPDITVDTAVAWQLDTHKGFVHSFMSSMQHAPIMGYEAQWERLGRHRKDKIMIFGASFDPLIIATELKADAQRLLGADKVEWRLIEGTHDFPATNSVELVQEICRFWGL